MQTEGITYINPQKSFQKYFDTKRNLNSQKSNLSLSNPQLSYDSDALFNSKIIQKQLSKDQNKYGKQENINQNYTSQSDLNRAMNYLKRKYQSINENPNQQNNQNMNMENNISVGNEHIKDMEKIHIQKQNSLEALKRKYLGHQISQDAKKNLETPQQYERAYQEKMREISDFLNLPQQPQFQTANTAHSSNYMNSVINSNVKGSTSQNLFSSNKFHSVQSQKQQISEMTQQQSKREYEPMSAHTSLLTASSFDHQSKLFGYPDYAYNQFKIDMLSQGLSVSKLSKQQFQLIQHQKRVRKKNQFKLWRDCRKVRNDDSKSAKDKGQIRNADRSKIEQKSVSNLKQSFIDCKSSQLNEIREKSGSRSCNQQIPAQNFRVASKTTESFKRKIMKDEDQKSSNIDASFQSKSVKRWDKSPIVKKNFYHQHLKKQYKPRLPARKKESDSISLNKHRNYPQNNENKNGKTHAFLTRLQPHLFQNFMDNYRNSNSTSQNNKNDWMQLNISQKAQKSKLKDLQVKVALKDDQKVKFYQEDKKSHRQKSQKQFENPPQPQILKISNSQIHKKPQKKISNYYSLTDQECEKPNHKRTRSAHNQILKLKKNKISDQTSQQQKKQFSKPFQQMDVITEKLKKFEIDQQNRLKSLQNLELNKTQIVNSNRVYPQVESLRTNESKQNDLKSPSFQNYHQKHSSKQISDISQLKDHQTQDFIVKDLSKSRNQLGKKIRRVKNERARRSSGAFNKSTTQVNAQNEQPEQFQVKEDTRQIEEDVFSCWEQEKTGEEMIWQESSQMSDLKLDTLISENMENLQMGETVIRVDQILQYQIQENSQNNSQNQNQKIETPEDGQINEHDVYEEKQTQIQKICMEYVDTHKNGSMNINNNWSQFLKLEGIDFQMQENQKIMRDFNKSAKVQSLLLSPRKESTANKSNRKIQSKLLSACKAKASQELEKPYQSKSSNSSDKQTCSMFEDQNPPEDQTVLKYKQVSKMSVLSSINNPTVVQKIEDFKKHLFSIQPFNELLPYSDFQLSGRTSQKSKRHNVNLTPKHQEIDQIIIKKMNDSAKIMQCTPLQDPNVVKIDKILYEVAQKFLQDDIVLQSKFEVTEESESEFQDDQKSSQSYPENVFNIDCLKNESENEENVKNISYQKSQNENEENISSINNQISQNENVENISYQKSQSDNEEIIQDVCNQKSQIQNEEIIQDASSLKSQIQIEEIILDVSNLKSQSQNEENISIIDPYKSYIEIEEITLDINDEKSQSNQNLDTNISEMEKFRNFNNSKINIRNIQLQINTDINDNQCYQQIENEDHHFKQQLHSKRSDFQEPSICDQETNCNPESFLNQVFSQSNNSIFKRSEQMNQSVIDGNEALANDYVFKLLEKIDCILQKRVIQIKNFQGSGRISSSEHDRQIQSIHQDYQNYDQIQSQLKKDITNEYACSPKSDESIQNQIEEQKSFRSPSQNLKKNFVSLNSASSSSYTKYIQKNKETKKFRPQNKFLFKGSQQIIQSSYEGSSSDKLSKSQSHFVNNPRLIEVNSNECLNDQIILLNPQKVTPNYNSEGGDCLKQNQSLQDYLFSPAEQQNHFQTFHVPVQQEIKQKCNINKYLLDQKSDNLRSEHFNGPEFVQYGNPLNEASFIQNDQENQNQDYILNLEIMLKQYVLRNPQARLPYQLLFRLVWEAESKILI